MDVIDRHVMIFLTTYFRTTPMADVNLTSLVTNNVPSLRFVNGRLGDLQITAYLRVAQRVFPSMMRIMQPANRGLACRIPCCRWQSGLFSASAVNVRVAHEFTSAIQPCNKQEVKVI